MDRKMDNPENISARKRAALERRRRRLPEEHPPINKREPCDAIKELRSLPPLPPEKPKDTRRADVIRQELRKVLPSEGAGFHGPLPRRKIGLD